MLYNETKDLIPELYFGGMEIPPYSTPPFLHAAPHSVSYLDDIISTIRSIGISSCGYIDDEGIHFHAREGEDIYIDLSRNFIFLSQPDLTGAENPSAWQILRFLQEPVKQALFIGAGCATLIRKTQYTLAICNELDRLWALDTFIQCGTGMIKSDKELEKALSCLMKIYEEETLGKCTEMWEFWDTFSTLLMVQHLGLSVQLFDSK